MQSSLCVVEKTKVSPTSIIFYQASVTDWPMRITLGVVLRVRRNNTLRGRSTRPSFRLLFRVKLVNRGIYYELSFKRSKSKACSRFHGSFYLLVREHMDAIERNAE